MKQIGNYFVEDIPIGSGGMGHVFRGTDSQGRPVAIKQILPNFVADIEYRSRIEREIEFLKKLNNDHVVRIYDHFEGEGNLFIVMELVEGLNVEQHVQKNGPIPWQDAVNYMVQLLMTMQDVHAHGIIHRDIKPGNIMIRPNGQICLLDFGVAKDSSSNAASGGTVFGTIIGTDGYMSPEQAQGLSIDHRSDIYGLGCVLYFMLTGTHAFGGMHSELKMQIAITQGEFPRLADKVKGLPTKLQASLDNAVNKNMMKRYQSCKEFATDLSGLTRGGTQIDTANRNNGPISVSIGRENCDVVIGTENRKVSRHHADVTLKRFTGGEFYIYTDCSSNGTTIDGFHLQKGMTYNIPKGTYPTILLANDPSCRLDIREVASELDRKMKQASAAEDRIEQREDSYSKYRNAGGNSQPSKGSNPNTFFGAIATCFKKYADFSGRASRAEYWWFYLFNFLITAICVGAQVPIVLETGDWLLELFIFLWLYSLAIFIPSLAVAVRRLHDTGKSWVNLLFGLIPLVGGIVLLVFFCTKGEPGPNRFGPPPTA